MCRESRCIGQKGKKTRILRKAEGKKRNIKRIRDNNTEEIDVRNYKETVACIAGGVRGSYRGLGREIFG